MRLLFFVALMVSAGCSSDTVSSGTPFDLGEADTGADMHDEGPDVSVEPPRPTCVPNDDPIVCENSTDRYITPWVNPFEWDCVNFVEAVWQDTDFVGSNSNLETLSGLEQAGRISMSMLENYHEEFSPTAPINPGLRHVDGLRNLKSAKIVIQNNVDLEDVDGLCNLREAPEIFLNDNPKLKSLRGLRNVRTPGVQITLRNTPSLPPEEVACLRKALPTARIGPAESVACPEGYWGDDTP
ncbi:MAG: hypothetical protein R3E66_02885 [bacterium]